MFLDLQHNLPSPELLTAWGKDNLNSQRCKGAKIFKKEKRRSKAAKKSRQRNRTGR